MKGAPVYIKEWELPTGIGDEIKGFESPNDKNTNGQSSVSGGDCYDLSGRKLSKTDAPDVYIKGGKKIVVK